MAANPQYTYLGVDDNTTQVHVDFLIQHARDHPGVPLCVDLEWDSHDPALRLSLVQVAVSQDTVLVFDALGVPGLLGRLKDLLEAEEPLKVMHGARLDAKVLAKHGVTLRGLFDTQLAHWILNECSRPEWQKGAPLLRNQLPCYVSCPMLRVPLLHRARPRSAGVAAGRASDGGTEAFDQGLAPGAPPMEDATTAWPRACVRCGRRAPPASALREDAG